MKIGEHSIGKEYPPFIIAEMSGNHNQSLERALQIVEAAAAAGAHAIKLQTYTADTMTLDLQEGHFFIDDPKSLWHGKTLYELYQEAHTPWEWHEPLFKRAQELGLIAFSTPFDETAVDFLENLSVPCYKIASFENTDIPLIRRVAATGKPLLISTGMANVAELDDAVRAAREAGAKDVILLKCTSSYPASPAHSNLRTIPHLRELFSCEAGLSDHTIGIGAAVCSVALGATVIEKHFTLKRSEGGVDAAFSIEPDELKQLVQETQQAWQALGQIKYGVEGNEADSLRYRRSLYIVKDIKKGDEITEKNVRVLRPGYGISAKFLFYFLGKKIKEDTKRGSLLTFEMI
ncbi:pseudaminic acid synthase [Candidatus Electronema sp. JM]|uniref:pseudaminic acid synthase n=1 Tax=Candidatus Electronema sp. JM TaxID=3401571 RepID=UPI003AA9DD31